MRQAILNSHTCTDDNAGFGITLTVAVRAGHVIAAIRPARARPGFTNTVPPTVRHLLKLAARSFN